MTASVSVAPTHFERALGLAAVVMLAAVIIAITKGYGTWSRIPLVVWGHVSTVVVALGLTPFMLWRRRGDRVHRKTGYIWVGAMFLTALISFGVRTDNGAFSVIHILSLFTLIQAPLIVVLARKHAVTQHRTAVRAMVIGALLIAGFFTFLPHRMLGQWLLG